MTAPCWACLWFGLSLVVVDALRYELAPPVGSFREATLGLFLLPLGAVGAVAARFGHALLPLGAGALVVLAVQDHYRGLEDLRLARMRSDAVAATLLAPGLAGADTPSPVKGPQELQLLQERGWVPEFERPDPTAAFLAPASAGYGAAAGGGPKHVYGSVRSSLRGETPQIVAVLAAVGDADPTVVGAVRPPFAGVGRDVGWRVDLAEPLPDGAVVRAVGLLVGSRRYAALGPRFVVRGGALEAGGP
mgnify:CR=1 FL=1